jgi:DNA (cytosine-5)-methyltransferase 1
MMGFPLGWVTDLDLPRTAQLRVVGNAVQPQVAETAARLLLMPLIAQEAAA